MSSRVVYYTRVNGRLYLSNDLDILSVFSLYWNASFCFGRCLYRHGEIVNYTVDGIELAPSFIQEQS